MLDVEVVEASPLLCLSPQVFTLGFHSLGRPQCLVPHAQQHALGFHLRPHLLVVHWLLFMFIIPIMSSIFIWESFGTIPVPVRLSVGLG
jgi:hypothetical protein